VWTRPVKIMPLSPRQKEICAAIAVGQTDKEIAAKLKISPATVGTHMKAILIRLGAKSRSHATAIFVHAGFSVPQP
jgi:DNA-binding CsgD family transcriptional regulator